MPLKDIVKDYAVAEGYMFNYGTRPYVNYEAIDKDMKDGKQIINMLPERRRLLYATSKPNPTSAEYSVFIQIARKFETGNATFSNQDEFYEQKYDRRLAELYQVAFEFVRALACSNNWEMVSYADEASINQYSSNIDLIEAEFVFRVPQVIT